MTVKIFCSTLVFWLSLGKVLKRIVKIEEELQIFLSRKDKSSIFADLFCVDKWLSAVCSVLDIFKKINNVSLQGKGDVLISEKVTVSQKKLMLWREHFEK